MYKIENKKNLTQTCFLRMLSNYPDLWPLFRDSLKGDWLATKLGALQSQLRLFSNPRHRWLICHQCQVSFIIFYLSIIVYMEPFVTMRGGQDYRHYVGIITIFILMDNDPKKLVMEYLFKYV